MGLTVYGGGGKPEEEKTVTAGTSTKVVTPSDGKTIKKVTVNPTPSQSKTVTPSTLQQTVSPDSGKLLSKVIVKAMEDVTPEVTAQTPVITQIAENLGVTITTPSGTNKQILQGNNANLLDIKNNAKKEGLYVWKKLTTEGGDFVDFVVSDSETAYPDGGEHGGYWYEKVVEGISGIDFGTVTPTSSSLKKITINHALGIKPSYAVILKKSSWTLRTSDEIVLAGSSGFVADRSEYSPKVYGSNITSHTATTTSVTFGTNDSSDYFGRGDEYIWFVIA